MTKRRATPLNCMMSIHDDPSTSGALRFTFVPTSVQQARAETNRLRRCLNASCPFRGSGARRISSGSSLRRKNATREAIESIASERVTARHEWLGRLRKLFELVKRWAMELDWATWIVEKKMEDAEIGNYKAPCLLIQQETVRLLLEPVARSAPGAEGIFDLNVMPSYDDIASLYYYNNQWNIHYMFTGAPTVANILEGEAKPLTKATIREVFEEMKAMPDEAFNWMSRIRGSGGTAWSCRNG